VGVGVFGFLINLPVVSYYEVHTILTPNHGHAAMMGVFGIFAMALMVFALRQLSSDEPWGRVERMVRISWGLNSGLALMVVTSLFPGGVLQIWDVLEHGYSYRTHTPMSAGRGSLRVLDPDCSVNGPHRARSNWQLSIVSSSSALHPAPGSSEQSAAAK